MIKATKKDKNLVIDILSDAFEFNPSVNWIVGNRKGKAKRLKLLIEYSFQKCLRDGTVLISNDKTGAAMYFTSTKPVFSIKELFWHLILAFKVIGIGRLHEILTRESFIKKHKLQIPHLYFWFLGVKKNNRNGKAARELSQYIFKEAKQLQLPILVETSEAKNILSYQKMGFKTYYKWENKRKKMNIWFMKKEQ